MNPHEAALRVVHRDLGRLKVPYALVGGWAVTAHGSLRTTVDVDAAVAVANDAEAESLVRQLTVVGYRLAYQIEQTDTHLLGGVRLFPPGRGSTVLVDLLFASSGIEAEIVAEATIQRVFANISMPVATVGHLIAMKVLAVSDERGKDLEDLRVLIPRASGAEIQRARQSVALIAERGFARHKDVVAELEQLLTALRS